MKCNQLICSLDYCKHFADPITGDGSPFTRSCSVPDCGACLMHACTGRKQTDQVLVGAHKSIYLEREMVCT